MLKKFQFFHVFFSTLFFLTVYLKKRLKTTSRAGIFLIFSVFTLVQLIEVDRVLAGGKSSDEYQLESLTVTAEKREENIQDVPISMDVFSDMQVEDANIGGITELTRYCPNLFTTPAVNINTIVIRGVSSINPALYPPALLFVNDIGYSLTTMQNPDLLDIERVEVLRGPQGTLYGKNTESGAINIVTKQPDNQLRGKIFGEYGFFDAPHGNVPFYKAGGRISGPIQKDKLFMGLAFQTRDSEGYMKNLFNGNEKAGETDHKYGQLTFRWTPVEKLDISFISNFSENNDGYGQIRYENGEDKTNPYQINWNGGNDWENEINSQVIRTKYSGEKIDILSITSRIDYRSKFRNDADFRLFDYGNQDFLTNNTVLSQEIRFSSSDDSEKFKWVCGLFGSKDDTDKRSETPAYFAVRYTEVENDSIAGFGQGTYTFFDKLHLTAGLRYEKQELKIRQENKFATTPVYSVSESNDEFLPKGSVSFDISDDVMTYFTVVKGFLSGGYNFMANDSDTLAVDPEYVTNYETGLKSTFFNNRLIINTAVFHLDIEDKQVIEWPVGQSPMLREVRNAAEASSDGFEFEIKARPLRGLDLFAGLGYTESKFDNWIAYKPTGDTFDYKNKHLPNVPEYTYNAGIQYRYENGLLVRTDILGTGEYYTDSENTQKVKGYETVNIKLGFERENYDIALWGKNIFQKDYVISRVNYFGSLVDDGEPLSFGLTATYRF